VREAEQAVFVAHVELKEGGRKEGREGGRERG
jgi:hypothetical protein